MIHFSVKFILSMAINIASYAVAHEAHQKKLQTIFSKTTLEAINKEYLKETKPIFENKCFNCHSSKVQFPWYQKVPGVKQWMQSDIDEARKHIDFESDFPFKSHATPMQDLVAIDDSIKRKKMPPMSYRLAHLNSALSKQEQEKVHQWVQYSESMLKKEMK